MFKYASKARLVVFTILSVIGIAMAIAGGVLSTIYDTPTYVLAGSLVALIIPSIWSVILEITEKQREDGNQ